MASYGCGARMDGFACPPRLPERHMTCDLQRLHQEDRRVTYTSGDSFPSIPFTELTIDDGLSRGGIETSMANEVFALLKKKCHELKEFSKLVITAIYELPE